MRWIGASVFLAALMLMSAARTGEAQPDPNYRFMTIERRLDQLQMRMELFERAVQNQSSANVQSDTTMLMLQELQRQNLSLAEQLVQLQKRTLDLQKAIDQLREASEKKEKPREDAKPKAKP